LSDFNRNVDGQNHYHLENMANF